jgi:hypothetical protein
MVTASLAHKNNVRYVKPANETAVTISSGKNQ